MTKLLAVTHTASIFVFGGISSSYLTPSMLSTRTLRSVGSTGPMVGRMANSHASERTLLVDVIRVDRPNGAFVTAPKIRERFIKIGSRVIEHIARTRPRSAA
jgi:hypothetical protein